MQLSTHDVQQEIQTTGRENITLEPSSGSRLVPEAERAMDEDAVTLAGLRRVRQGNAT